VKIDRFFIKNMLNNRLLEPSHVATREQVVDCLTKGLASSDLTRLCDKIGLVDIFLPRLCDKIGLVDIFLPILRGNVEIY
jgi:hypothetical protein